MGSAKENGPAGSEAFPEAVPGGLAGGDGVAELLLPGDAPCPNKDAQKTSKSSAAAERLRVF